MATPLANYAIFDGDSLTESGYPVGVLVRVGNGVQILNVSANGTGHGRQFPTFDTDAPTILDPFYSASYHLPVCVFWGGYNNMRTSGDPAVTATTYAAIVDYCGDRRAVGWKAFVLTMIPSIAATTHANYETERLSINAQIRANWPTFADGLVDIGGDGILGSVAQAGGDYFSTDGIHLRAQGYDRVALLVANVLSAYGR